MRNQIKSNATHCTKFDFVARVFFRDATRLLVAETFQIMHYYYFNFSFIINYYKFMDDFMLHMCVSCKAHAVCWADGCGWYIFHVKLKCSKTYARHLTMKTANQSLFHIANFFPRREASETKFFRNKNNFLIFFAWLFLSCSVRLSSKFCMDSRRFH